MGFDGVKPHSRGTLTFSANTVQFAAAKGSAAVLVAAIPRYSLNHDCRETVPGAAGWLLQTAPLLGLINPLVEGATTASGVGMGMFRTGVSALEFDYVDSSRGLHKAVFLLPRNAGDSAQRALASLSVPIEAVALAPHPTFSKTANLLSGRITLGKGVGSIRVADLPAGEGGMPPFLEALIYEQLISRLNSSGYFRHVLRAGEDVPSGGTGELFTLQMSISAFAEGKPRLRLATIGFGKTRITAELRVSNSSNTLLRDNIVNASIGDDQSSSDACRLLVMRVAKLVTNE
jgi:hypothetical protein